MIETEPDTPWLFPPPPPRLAAGERDDEYADEGVQESMCAHAVAPFAVSVVDAETGVGIEEMQRAGLHGDLGGLALADARASAEAADHGGGARLRLLELTCDRRVHILRELAHLFGQRRPRLHPEVDHDLRAEGFPELDDAAKAMGVGFVGNERGVLDVLRADPYDHRAAVVLDVARASRRARPRRVGSSDRRYSPRNRRSRARGRPRPCSSRGCR